MFSCKKLRKNNFNSSVMAGEEPGKMPELYVEALLEEHGLGKRPQAAMRSKSKRVRNLLPTPPVLASELRRQLELPENVETWMQAYEHLQSTMDERACAYEALQAAKRANAGALPPLRTRARIQTRTARRAVVGDKRSVPEDAEESSSETEAPHKPARYASKNMH